ncbi:hypothetical protein [Pseudomonas psychrophila]|uniref:Ig-like domain-containing protein n=1 Tax=Pseudomonas psychrophila TaxID=122355 RepID=A0A8I1FW95_9PSED|nr:hypothetical protein [Pseudomonas psychrophila]MBJ2259218.1 hypothetical protein [Pseudomonas psychrophila]
MIVHFDAYALSGRHHHIATLKPGVPLRGLYLITSPPSIQCKNNEEFYSFTISDLTGQIPCLIPTYRVHWQPSPKFVSQRVAIEGSAVMIKETLTCMVTDLEPVKIIW